MLRNSNGQWIRSFSLQFGITTDNIATIWVVRHRLAWNMGFKYDNLQIDSTLVLH